MFNFKKHQNLISAYANQYAYKSPKRLVFFAFAKGVEITSSAPTTLAERATALKGKESRNYLNVETNFIANNPDVVLQALAQSAIEKGQKTSFDELKSSFQDNLDPKQNLDSFWKYLKENGCKTVAIINGVPAFFAGPNRTMPIDIQPMLRPITGILGGDPLSRETKIESTSEENRTRHALGDLIAEIDLSKLGPIAANIKIPSRYQIQEHPKTNIA